MPQGKDPLEKGTTYGPLVGTVVYSLYLNQLATWNLWL